jgi:hypothetical protein
MVDLTMKNIITIFLFLSAYSTTKAQSQNCAVLLNHFYISVDTITYQAILDSEILNTDFAYAYEKIRDWGGGIYIIGKDTYIEIFHPTSITDEYIPTGFSWICYTSLVANCMEKYNLPDTDLVKYATYENFDELSVFTQDSVYKSNAHGIITTREMNMELYEGLVKKPFHDSLKFQTTDYNNQAESDSSKNFFFKNVTGIEVNVNTRDSASITEYLNLIGYNVESKEQNSLKFTNAIDFIQLHFSNNIDLATISVIHFELNKPCVSKRLSLGNSEMIMENNTGRWIINKQ